MTTKKVLRLKSDPIYIKSFGSAVAMNFQNNSGSVEVYMTFPEVDKVLDAFREFETTKPEPDTEIVAAIDKLTDAFYGSDIQMVLDVPMAQNRVLLRPALIEDES